MAEKERLFDPATLKKFEALTLQATQVRAGVMKGERRSTKRGTSIEFADYRNYVKGDDLRRVDWNVYARLERPFIKLLEEEEDLSVHLLIDSSASMDWPRQQTQRAAHKYIWALRALAGIAYLSLAGGDRLHVGSLRQDRVQLWGPHRGRGYILSLLSHLEKLYTRGETDLNQLLNQYAVRAGKRPGLCFLFSDMMSPTYQDGLSALLARGFELVVIQVLSPDEVRPDLNGDLRLIDAETGLPQEVTIDAAMVELYHQRLLNWQQEMGDFCLKRGIHFLSVDTDLPWEQLILLQLRRIGVVR